VHRVYDCRELVEQMDGSPEENFQKLTTVITTSIDAESWSSKALTAGIAEIGGIFSVRQTQRNHEEIENLLNLIRQKLEEDFP